MKLESTQGDNLMLPQYPKLVMKDGKPQCPVCDRTDGLMLPLCREIPEGMAEYHCGWCDIYCTLDTAKAQWIKLHGIDLVELPGDANLEGTRQEMREPDSLFARRLAGELPPVDVDDPDSILD